MAPLRLESTDRIGKGTQEFLIHPQYCPPLARHHVRLTGISLASKEFRFVNLPALYPQILVTLRGKGKVLIGDEWQEVDSGTAYCTPAGKNCGYAAVSNWEVGWITYEKKAIFNFTEVTLLEVDPRPLENVLYGLYQESTTRQEPRFLDHWGELLQGYGQRIMEWQRPGRLWHLWQKVQADLAFPWTLPHLAKLAGVSSEYLRQMSLQETGLTPMRQVTHLRMQQAMSLLSKGYKVEAAGREVGHDNPFAFSTTFKKFTGKSPSHFRSG